MVGPLHFVCKIQIMGSTHFVFIIKKNNIKTYFFLLLTLQIWAISLKQNNAIQLKNSEEAKFDGDKI